MAGLCPIYHTHPGSSQSLQPLQCSSSHSGSLRAASYIKRKIDARGPPLRSIQPRRFTSLAAVRRRPPHARPCRGPTPCIGVCVLTCVVCRCIPYTYTRYFLPPAIQTPSCSPTTGLRTSISHRPRCFFASAFPGPSPRHGRSRRRQQQQQQQQRVTAAGAQSHRSSSSNNSSCRGGRGRGRGARVPQPGEARAAEAQGAAAAQQGRSRRGHPRRPGPRGGEGEQGTSGVFVPLPRACVIAPASILDSTLTPTHTHTHTHIARHGRAAREAAAGGRRARDLLF